MRFRCALILSLAWAVAHEAHAQVSITPGVSAWTCAAAAEGSALACATPLWQPLAMTSRVWAGNSGANAWRTFSALAGTINVRTCATANVSADLKNCSSVQWRAKSSLITQASEVSNLGQVTFRWTAPTTNTDSTPLTDLAGYRLYQSTSGDLTEGAVHPNISPVADIEDARALTFGPYQLTPGTYYFALTAYAGTDKRESLLSKVLTRVISAPAPVTVSLACEPGDALESATPACQWSSTNATACTAAGGWSGTKALTGSETLAKITVSSEYRLTCSGPGGSATGSVKIGISPRPNSPASFGTDP